MRKTSLILAGIVLLYAAACSKKNPPDGPLPAPLQKMIAQDTNCVCEPFLEKLLWRNQVVYALGYTSATCDWTPFYYDAAGEPLVLPAGTTLGSFALEAKDIKRVWSCGH